MPKLRKLHMMRSMVPLLDTRTVRPPAKPLDPIYNTPAFKTWSAQVVERAGHRCEAVDAYGLRCTRARPDHKLYADHIKELRDGGSLTDLNNGQALCASHHELKTHAARAQRMKR